MAQASKEKLERKIEQSAGAGAGATSAADDDFDSPVRGPSCSKKVFQVHIGGSTCTDVSLIGALSAWPCHNLVFGFVTCGLFGLQLGSNVWELEFLTEGSRMGLLGPSSRYLAIFLANLRHCQPATWRFDVVKVLRTTLLCIYILDLPSRQGSP